ncbi:MAG: protease, partial [Lacisediminimonas sp.]|nr:protease [Lacisediminimonas sp.]
MAVLRPLMLGVLLLAGCSQAAQAAPSERQRQKHAAEQERAALRGKLAGLRRDIERTESARSHASDALAASERAISQANRALAELAQEQRETAARIDTLQQQHRTLDKQIAQRKQQLARLAHDQYLTGGSDRSRLLLSGDNPTRINRDLQYLGYVSKAQAAVIARLQADLGKIDDNTEQTRSAQQDLEEIAADQRQQKALLEKEKSKRAILLGQLSDKLNVQRKEAGSLQRDEQRMALLVDRLSRLLEQQRRAELAQARQREQARQKAAQKEAERQRRLAQAKKPNAPFKPDPIDSDEKPSATEPAAAPPLAGADMAALRGKLRLPVKGELVARFGSRRVEGNNWKGLFIRAQEGAEVRSVAGGRVAYADWLRG